MRKEKEKQRCSDCVFVCTFAADDLLDIRIRNSDVLCSLFQMMVDGIYDEHQCNSLRIEVSENSRIKMIYTVRKKHSNWRENVVGKYVFFSSAVTFISIYLQNYFLRFMQYI